MDRRSAHLYARGVMNAPKNLITAQNYDLQFGTNVIGHYFLSKLLIPLMETTAATLPPTDPVRLIELTSDGHLSNANKGAELINYDSILLGQTRDGTGSMQLYCQSKSGNILLSSARARLFSGKNMISMSVHPGMSLWMTSSGGIISNRDTRAHKVGTGSPYICCRSRCSK